MRGTHLMAIFAWRSTAERVKRAGLPLRFLKQEF
jgi:hypothetical protein